MPLRVEGEQRGTELTLTLTGVINEHSELSFELGSSTRLVFNLGGIRRVNSTGVRLWINVMNALSEREIEIVLRHVPPVMLLQASVMFNFFGTATVESFFTPWCCLECGHQELILNQYDDEIPEFCDCPECNSAMEFDDARASFFAFRDHPVES